MEDLEASLKAKIEEAGRLIATMGQDKLRLTETLEQKDNKICNFFLFLV